jgi:RNA polymerase sigma factor (TIGR02999 family)
LGRKGTGKAVNTSVDVTRLLHSAQAGDTAALEEALRQMYAALHRLAGAQLRRNTSERTLSATALVNEAYIKVFGGGSSPQWESRGHLLGVAARAMREVLVDSARRRQAAKRPQDCDRIELSEISGSLMPEVDYVALIDALDALEQIDPRQASIVSMRFFVGLSAEQIAAALGISATTVQREWRLARAWLQREMQG